MKMPSFFSKISKLPKLLFKKTQRSAMFGSSLDYIGRGGYGSGFHSASKFDGGLVNYQQPSSIDIAQLRSESRKALIDSPELIALKRTLTVLVIADGLKVSSAPERAFVPELSFSRETQLKEYRKIIDTLWEMCADSTSFDVFGERNLACLMQDAFEKWIQDGEVCILFTVETDPQKLAHSLTPIRVSFVLPEDLKNCRESRLDLAEGHTVENGIELDGKGLPVAYWIKGQRIEKYCPETGCVMVSLLKNGQTLRGIPPLSCAIQEAKLLQDYQLAEVQRNALGSQIFMTATENQTEIMRRLAEQKLKKTGGCSSQPEDIIKLSRQGVNLLKVANHGQIASIDTPKPTPVFTDFTTTVQKRICMTAGMARDIVTKDISSSYSAARFQAQLTDLEIASYRMRFIDCFVRPLYENWFKYCVDAGHFSFVKSFKTPLHQKSWMAIEVIGRPLPDLSPLQEANALKTYLEMGVLSRSDIAKMLGYPKWEDTQNTLETERKATNFFENPQNRKAKSAFKYKFEDFMGG